MPRSRTEERGAARAGHWTSNGRSAALCRGRGSYGVLDAARPGLRQQSGGRCVIAKRRNLVFSALLSAVFAWPAGAADDHWSLLSSYCTDCHNATDWAGSVAFDTMTPDAIPGDAKVWESAVRKLRGHLMPPPGSPQPKPDEAARFVAWMEGQLDANASAPRAGHVGVQRLNRDEYQLEIKDLLGVDIKAKDLLPSENEVEGFNNIAAALSVSPAFLDQYIDAARVVARLAVGSPVPKMANAFYAAPAGFQDVYVDGFPPGTRGGLLFRHTFPLDGEYRFNLLDLDVGLYPSSVETRHTVVVLVDRKEIFRGDLGGADDLHLVNREGADGRRKIFERFQNIPAKVTAGSHEVIITFVERSRAPTDESIAGRAGGFGGQGGPRGPRLLDGVQVVGPFGDAHSSRTATRAKIFVCTPVAATEERACAEKIAEQLARRAYRRPVVRADVDKLMPFYETGRKQAGGFDAGIEQVVAAVLSSPDFLYRAIRPADGGDVCADGSGARVAAVVLPVGPGPGRCAARPRQQREAARPRDPRCAGAPHARRCTRAGAGGRLRAEVAEPRRARARWSRIRACSRATRRSCARISRRRYGCSSRRCCSATRASSRCSIHRTRG